MRSTNASHADLEDPVGLGRGVREAALRDRRLLHSVSDTISVVTRRRLGIERHGHAVLLYDGVALPEASHSGVDSEGEQVLVVRREHTGADDRAVRRGLPRQDGVCGQDARGASLEVQVGRLVELPAQDVLR